MALEPPIEGAKQRASQFDVLRSDPIRPSFSEETAMSRFSEMCAATAARSILFCCALLAALSLAGPLPSARAAITPTGDVSPSNPSGWTSSTNGIVGNTASGTLTVDGGSDLLSNYGYIGS
jgi:hypothetical protein